MRGVARAPRIEWPEVKRRGHQFARDGHIVYDLATEQPIWYKVADEPDLKGLSPTAVKIRNAAIKLQYPTLRTYIVVAGSSPFVFWAYRDCADMMAADIYLGTDTLFLFKPIEWLWAAVRFICAGIAWRGREWIGVYPAWTQVPNTALPPVRPWIMLLNRWCYRAVGATHDKAWCWEFGKGLL